MLHNIGVIGGFEGFQNDPQSTDYKFVMPAMDYLRRSGVEVSAKPDFDCVNFADKRNFLDEEKEYDAVFIAHVPNGRNLSWTRMSFQMYSQWTDVTEKKQLANTIDSRTSSDRWAQRIKRSGAKIVLTVGSYIEIDQNYLSTSQHFNQYATIITPKDDPSIVGVGSVHESDKIEKIYGDDLDVPYQWLGISVHKDYIEEIKQSGKTDLSQRLIRDCSFA